MCVRRRAPAGPLRPPRKVSGPAQRPAGHVLAGLADRNLGGRRAVSRDGPQGAGQYNRTVAFEMRHLECVSSISAVGVRITDASDRGSLSAVRTSRA